MARKASEYQDTIYYNKILRYIVFFQMVEIVLI